MKKGFLFLNVVVLFALCACSERAVDELPESCQVLPLFVDRDVDLLFVIDNSQGVAHLQQHIVQQFPYLIAALNSHKLGQMIPNLRIGVVTSDLGIGPYISAGCNNTGGDKGKLQNKPQVALCTPPRDGWIDFRYDEKTNKAFTNVPGASTDPTKAVHVVKDAFHCIASIGIDGCGFEQPLESARKALDPRLNTNPGFLRHDPKQNQDAVLGVLILMDEDDCSAKDTELFNTKNTALSDPLGPWTSFRCFEFGVTCDCGSKPCNRTFTGERKNCVPKSTGKLYLHTIEDYISFFANLKRTPEGRPRPQRVVMSAIAGPFDGIAQTEMIANVPGLKYSCLMAPYPADPAIRIQALVHAVARELTAQEISDIKANKSKQPYFVDKKGNWREDNHFSACTSDYRPALEQFGRRIVGALKTACLHSPPLTASGGIACDKGDVLYEDSASGKKVLD